MTLLELCDKIAHAKIEVQKRSSDEPDTIFIHPDTAKDAGLVGGEIIHGLKVEIPTWEQLGLIAGFAKVDVKSKAFWDRDSAYILKNQMKPT